VPIPNQTPQSNPLESLLSHCPSIPKYKILAAMTNFSVTTTSQNKNITFLKKE